MATFFVIMIAFLVGGIGGLLVFPYLVVRALLEASLRHELRGMPDEAFHRALGYSLLWGFVFFAPLLPFHFMYLMAGLGGAVVWLVLWFAGKDQRTKLHAIRRAHPPPKYHIWMQDLYAAIFLYGTCMTLLLALYPDQQGRETYVISLCLYLFLAQGFSLYVMLDVLRFSRKPPVSRRRIEVIVWLALFTTFFFPVTWLAWRSWQHAMTRLELKPVQPPRSEAPAGAIDAPAASSPPGIAPVQQGDAMAKSNANPEINR